MSANVRWFSRAELDANDRNALEEVDAFPGSENARNQRTLFEEIQRHLQKRTGKMHLLPFVLPRDHHKSSKKIILSCYR